jgi:hypothetical protein
VPAQKCDQNVEGFSAKRGGRHVERRSKSKFSPDLQKGIWLIILGWCEERSVCEVLTSRRQKIRNGFLCSLRNAAGRCGSSLPVLLLSPLGFVCSLSFPYKRDLRSVSFGMKACTHFATAFPYFNVPVFSLCFRVFPMFPCSTACSPFRV